MINQLINTAYRSLVTTKDHHEVGDLINYINANRASVKEIENYQATGSLFNMIMISRCYDQFKLFTNKYLMAYYCFSKAVENNQDCYFDRTSLLIKNIEAINIFISAIEFRDNVTLPKYSIDFMIMSDMFQYKSLHPEWSNSWLIKSENNLKGTYSMLTREQVIQKGKECHNILTRYLENRIFVSK